MKQNVPSRELRNNAARLIEQVEAGAEIVITRRGQPVAQLVPVQTHRRTWVPGTEFARRIAGAQADAGLRNDLERLAGETTDDLGPIS